MSMIHQKFIYFAVAIRAHVQCGGALTLVIGDSRIQWRSVDHFTRYEIWRR